MPIPWPLPCPSTRRSAAAGADAARTQSAAAQLLDSRRNASRRAEGLERGGHRVVSLTHDLRPAPAVEEEVVERDPAEQRGVDRIDDRQRVAERLLTAAGELQVIALLELAAAVQDP